jgi:hypothetical protein
MTGVPADHRLYKDYRQALLNEKLEEALLAGRLILKLNPGDTQAQTDIERLQARVLEEKMEALGRTLRKKNASGVLDCIAQIETLNLPTSMQHAVWKEAQLFQIRLKLEELEQVHQGGDWLRALWGIDELRVLLARHGLQLESSDLDHFSQVESWASAKNAAFQEEQTYRRALGVLESEFDVVEKLVLSTPQVSLQDLRAAKTRLGTRWEEFVRLPQPPSDPLQKRHLNAQRLLIDKLALLEQARRKKFRIVSISAACGVIAVVTLLAFVAAGSSQAREIRRLISVRDLTALSNHLAAAKTKLTARANLGGLATAVKEAEASLAKEQALKLAYDQLCKEVQAAIPPSSEELSPTNLVAIQSKVNALTTKCRELAPEFLTTAETRLSTITNAWFAYLEPRGQSVNNSFRNLLSEVDKLADRVLQYTNSVDAVVQTLETDINPRMEQMRALASTQVRRLQISSNLMADFNRRCEQVGTVKRETTNYTAMMTGLAEARTLDDYLSRLALVAKSPFHRSIEGRFTAVPSWGSAATNALGRLLFRNDTGAWDYFLKVSGQIFRPAKELPKEEKDRLNEMLSQDWVAHITRYTVKPGAGDDNTNLVFLLDVSGLGFDTKKVNGRDICYGSVYDPTNSPAFPTFQPKEYIAWRLGDQSKKAPVTPEREVMISTGFRDLAEERGDKSHGVLHCLDALNQHRSGNPLCRAWVFLEASAILETNQYLWGVQYAPAVMAHRDRILQIVEGSLRPGDWMTPSKQKYCEKLEAHFERVRGISYVKQASFMHALVAESAQAGLVFVGYADVQGRLVLMPNASRDQDLFGWDKSGLRLQLLARWNKPTSRHSSVCDPAPLSPVYALQKDREGIKGRAASSIPVSMKDPSVESWLPPLFNEP